MKLGISNLAWSDTEQLKKICCLLENNHISYIEVVLPMHLEWESCDLAILHAFVETVNDRGLEIVSTQAICHGTSLTGFTGKDFVEHVGKVSNICKQVGVDRLVLGAPKLRSKESIDTLPETFKYIDQMIGDNNQTLLIEPNSRLYGGAFFYRVEEIVNFIRTNQLTNTRTMVDTHNCLLENEHPAVAYEAYRDYIKHIHVSEQQLGSFISSNAHIELATLLRQLNYKGLVVYEAKPSRDLKTDLELFVKAYNN